MTSATAHDASGDFQARVLHVMDHSLPEMSGYAFRSRYVVRTQRSFGIDARILTSARHQKFDQLFEQIEDLSIWRTPWPSSASEGIQLKVPFWRERILTRAMTRRILEAAEEFRPEILHAHSPLFDGQAAIRAGQRLGLPVVYEIRAFWEDDSVSKRKFSENSPIYKAVRKLETQVCKQADQVTVICQGLKDDLIGRGIPKDKITIIGNGIEAELFQPIPRDEALAERLGLSGKTVIGFMGTFAYYEGLPLLVEALARLAPDHPDLRLLLVGGGEAEGEVQEAIARTGMADRVVLTGRVPHQEIGSYYSISDALAYPRVRRRITDLVTPLKPLEALCMEKTVFGSTAGGVRELLEDVGAGRIFQAESVEDLARSIAEWLAAPEAEREKERTEGRIQAARKRPWSRTVLPILDVYARILGRGLAAPKG